MWLVSDNKKNRPIRRTKLAVDMTRQADFDYSPSRGPADPALGGISLVLPVCNESFIIEQTLRNYIAELGPRISDFEVVVAQTAAPMIPKCPRAFA